LPQGDKKKLEVKVRVKAHPPVDGVQGIEVWKKYKIGKKEVRQLKVRLPGAATREIDFPSRVCSCLLLPPPTSESHND
jgi:hypothetical protein